MGLLLYAITTPPTTEPSRRVLSVSGLTVWTDVLGADPSPVTRSDLLEHHRVVTEVFGQVEACLPARFPTVLADEPALIRHLEERREELASQLEAVRGACELAITAVWTAPDDTAPAEAEADGRTPGRQYLLRRQAELTASDQRHARANELAAMLEREAGRALRATERHVCPSKEVALSLALLVDRVRAEGVRQRLGRVERRDVRILVQGPWPPYTFGGLRSTAGEKR